MMKTILNTNRHLRKSLMPSHNILERPNIPVDMEDELSSTSFLCIIFRKNTYTFKYFSK